MHFRPAYPTPEHEAAARRFTEFITGNFDADAVLLVNSCARGKATRDSCLDIIMLARPDALRAQLDSILREWHKFEATDPTIANLRAVGKYSVVHADFVHGEFAPQERDEAAGPDSFELEIGNFLAYSVPLWHGSDYYAELKGKWLPYYSEDMRAVRLNKVRDYCRNNLHHIAPYVERGLYFQAFDRLYNAYREFLQALFIARRTYPIAYNKWIKDQVVEILGMPELYARLPRLFQVSQFESAELTDKAVELEEMLDHFAPAPGDA